MADVVDVDLYADDVEPDFVQKLPDEPVDVYDDIVADENSSNVKATPDPNTNSVSSEPAPNLNGADDSASDSPIKRFQLYVGNLTWWTSDQDITDAVHAISGNDFLDVKFFENRINGQSKGFCVLSFASESVMRICMEKLPKKELNGQRPVVTYPSLQAFNQFDSQSKTRVVPPSQSNSNRPQHTVPPPQMNNPPRLMMPTQQQQPPFRGRLPTPGMLGGPPMQPSARMSGPPHQMMQGIPPNMMPNRQMLPGFHPGPRQGMMPQAMPPQSRPLPSGMFQGPPPLQGMTRLPYQGGPPQTMHNYPCAPPANWNPQSNNAMGPPVHGMPSASQRPPPPQQLPSAPYPSVFQQSQPQSWHQTGQGYGSQSSARPHGGADEHRRDHHKPAIDELEFEEIMNRNRTVSSSAITRAVADAASGDYSSAIDTLRTAISLIKQSKVSADCRCKILINSLEVTLRGVETKSYKHGPRDRSGSRDRDRYHKRSRSDRSRSREWRERSRENDRHREREKESRYHDDRHRDRYRDGHRVEREHDRRERSESSHRISRH